MEPLEYLRILRRRWRWVAAVVVVGLLAAWVTAPSDPPDPVQSYRATHTLILKNGSGEGAGNAQTIEQMAFLATVGEVPKLVAERLGDDTDPAILASSVDAGADTGLGTLRITVHNRDPERAEQLANAFAEGLLTFLADQAVQAQENAVASTVDRMDQLDERIGELDSQIASGAGELARQERDALVRQYGLAYERYQQLASQGPSKAPLETIEEASAIPVSEGGFRAPASVSGRLFVGGGLALLLGVGLALVLERLDTRLRSKEGAERAFGLPVIAEIPHKVRRNRLPTAERPDSAVAEDYRSLRTALLYMQVASFREARGNGTGNGDDAAERTNGHRELRVILVSSPGPGEGKTTTVANLAASFAETGRRVLVVNSDLRRPKVQRYLDVEDQEWGLSDVLRSEEQDLRTAVVETGIAGVSLVPDGHHVDNPAELIVRGRDVLASARDLADIVILDTPPMLFTNDAVELMAIADAVVIVGRAGRTTIESGHRVGELLERLGAPASGVALVGAPKIPSSQRYRYGYYARYYLDHQGLFGWRRWLRRRGSEEPLPGPSVAGDGAEEPAPAKAEDQGPEIDLIAEEAKLEEVKAKAEEAKAKAEVAEKAEKAEKAEADDDQAKKPAASGAGSKRKSSGSKKKRQRRRVDPKDESGSARLPRRRRRQRVDGDGPSGGDWMRDGILPR